MKFVSLRQTQSFRSYLSFHLVCCIRPINVFVAFSERCDLIRTKSCSIFGKEQINDTTNVSINEDPW